MFRVLYELTAAQRSRYSDSSSCGAEKTAAETEEGTCLRSQSPTPCGPHGLEAGRRDSTLRALMKDAVLAELRGGPAWAPRGVWGNLAVWMTLHSHPWSRIIYLEHLHLQRSGRWGTWQDP